MSVSRIYRAAPLLAAVALLAVAGQPKAAAPEAAITLKVVRYPELVEAVKAQQGKVVVVDVWGTFCIPCKKEFPRLVELHRRYAKDGLVCMSAAVDPPAQREAALAFLKSKGAAFANYLLDEDPAVWQQKWDLKGVPAVFVFDRAGKRAARFDNDDPAKQFTYDDVERLVRRLLAEKP